MLGNGIMSEEINWASSREKASGAWPLEQIEDIYGVQREQQRLSSSSSSFTRSFEEVHID